MILTLLVIVLFAYFPRFRYAVLEGDRNYGNRESDGVVSIPFGGPSNPA